MDNSIPLFNLFGGLAWVKTFALYAGAGMAIIGFSITLIALVGKKIRRRKRKQKLQDELHQ